MNRGKCNWNCCYESNNWGCGKTNANHWCGYEQKNKCEEKKEDKKICCFCHEFEKKQEDKKQCPCGKEIYGLEYNNYGYGYDNFYSQGY